MKKNYYGDCPLCGSPLIEMTREMQLTTEIPTVSGTATVKNTDSSAEVKVEFKKAANHIFSGLNTVPSGTLHSEGPVALKCSKGECKYNTIRR